MIVTAEMLESMFGDVPYLPKLGDTQIYDFKDGPSIHITYATDKVIILTVEDTEWEGEED